MQSNYGSLPNDDVIINGHHGDGNVKHNELHRHLSLFDLVCVGVGATVGSGVFVLIGLIGKFATTLYFWYFRHGNTHQVAMHHLCMQSVDISIVLIHVRLISNFFHD